MGRLVVMRGCALVDQFLLLTLPQFDRLNALRSTQPELETDRLLPLKLTDVLDAERFERLGVSRFECFDALVIDGRAITSQPFDKRFLVSRRHIRVTQDTDQ